LAAEVDGGEDIKGHCSSTHACSFRQTQTSSGNDAQGVKVFWFFFSRKNKSSFVLRKRSKKTFIPGAAFRDVQAGWTAACGKDALLQCFARKAG
jgi:hypothetical protein